MGAEDGMQDKVLKGEMETDQSRAETDVETAEQPESGSEETLTATETPEDLVTPETAQAFVDELTSRHMGFLGRCEAFVHSRLDPIFIEHPKNQEILSNPDTLASLVAIAQTVDQTLVAEYLSARAKLYREGRSRDDLYSAEYAKQREELDDSFFSNSAFASLREEGQKLQSDNPSSLLGAVLDSVGEIKDRDRLLQELFSGEKIQELVSGLDKQSEELGGEQLGQQLRFRERYLKTFLKLYEMGEEEVADLAIHAASIKKEDIDAIYSTEDISESPVRIAASPFRGEVFDPEKQLLLAALILSPNLNTRRFVSVLEDTQAEAFSELTFESFPPSMTSAPSLARSEPIKVGILRAFVEGKFKGWQDKKVLEAGGDSAVANMTVLGAEELKSAAPGYDYYSNKMGSDRPDEFLSLGNYLNFGAPHEADLICSAQLFDIGSGIELTTGGDRGDRDDFEEASANVMLAMSNLLKQSGGYMIHDASAPDELMEEIGLERVTGLNFELAMNKHARIFRSTGEPKTRKVSVGKKKAKLDPENGTWSLG